MVDHAKYYYVQKSSGGGDDKADTRQTGQYSQISFNQNSLMLEQRREPRH